MVALGFKAALGFVVACVFLEALGELGGDARETDFAFPSLGAGRDLWKSSAGDLWKSSAGDLWNSSRRLILGEFGGDFVFGFLDAFERVLGGDFGAGGTGGRSSAPRPTLKAYAELGYPNPNPEAFDIDFERGAEPVLDLESVGLMFAGCDCDMDCERDFAPSWGGSGNGRCSAEVTVEPAV